MTDDLVERLLDWPYQGETMAHEAAARIEALTADKRFIIEERDRTFALMLARAEKAETERDAAYARGYSDAEAEISKSSLGKSNAFLHSQCANAADRVRELTAERDKYEWAWMTAEGKLADAESDIAYLHKLLAEDDARAILKGETP